MNYNDETRTIQDLKKLVEKLVKDRDWEKFNTPNSLTMNLAIEASELMKIFLWRTPQESIDELSVNREEIEDEAGDVLLSLLQFCLAANIDLYGACKKKIAKIEAKYPVSVYKGKHTKHRINKS